MKLSLSSRQKKNFLLDFAVVTMKQAFNLFFNPFFRLSLSLNPEEFYATSPERGTQNTSLVLSSLSVYFHFDREHLFGCILKLLWWAIRHKFHLKCERVEKTANKKIIIFCSNLILTQQATLVFKHFSRHKLKKSPSWRLYLHTFLICMPTALIRFVKGNFFCNPCKPEDSAISSLLHCQFLSQTGIASWGSVLLSFPIWNKFSYNASKKISLLRRFYRHQLA